MKRKAERKFIEIMESKAGTSIAISIILSLAIFYVIYLLK